MTFLYIKREINAGKVLLLSLLIRIVCIGHPLGPIIQILLLLIVYIHIKRWSDKPDSVSLFL